jgi:hypothetical protein
VPSSAAGVDVDFFRLGGLILVAAVYQLELVSAAIAVPVQATRVLLRDLDLYQTIRLRVPVVGVDDVGMRPRREQETCFVGPHGDLVFSEQLNLVAGPQPTGLPGDLPAWGRPRASGHHCGGCEYQISHGFLSFVSGWIP